MITRSFGTISARSDSTVVLMWSFAVGTENGRLVHTRTTPTITRGRRPMLTITEHAVLENRRASRAREGANTPCCCLRNCRVRTREQLPTARCTDRGVPVLIDPRELSTQAWRATQRTTAQPTHTLSLVCESRTEAQLSVGQIGCTPSKHCQN